MAKACALQYVYTVIVNLLLVEHKAVCTMVSLDIFVVDTIPLIRQLLSIRVISVDYVKSNDNIVDPLTKWLNIELVEKSSKGMGLKPVKE